MLKKYLYETPELSFVDVSEDIITGSQEDEIAEWGNDQILADIWDF